MVDLQETVTFEPSDGLPEAGGRQPCRRPFPWIFGWRVFAAVPDGASHRAVALRFRVSVASVSRWRRRATAQGDPGPKALGGDRRSGRIEQHQEQILGGLADQPDLTIKELRRALAARGLRFGFGTLHRFLVHHRMTRKKKTGHASEQDRPDVHQSYQAWTGNRAHLDPARPVFLDEMWTKTNMARTDGCAPRGQRVQMSVLHGHWHTSTVITRLTLRGMIAPCVLDGPMNRDAFVTCVEQALVPELRPSDVVILDNLPSHKGPKVRNLIHAAGAELVFLPPYSPDYNPTELAFSRLKALLRKAAKRTVEGLWDAIGRIVEGLLAIPMPQLLQGRRM